MEKKPENKSPLSFRASKGKMTDSPDQASYECCICHKMIELYSGQRIKVYISETIGAAQGFICPECDALKK